MLIALVEGIAAEPVPATLVGYVAGGLVSYALNRRHTYESTRPHREATWRFAVVAFVGFLLTWGFMHAFVEWLGAPYLPAQMVTTGIVMLWSFVGPQGMDVCVSSRHSGPRSGARNPGALTPPNEQSRSALVLIRRRLWVPGSLRDPE